MNMKVCSECGRELLVTNFFKEKKSKDGFFSWCKECTKEYCRVNKYHMDIYQKQYRENNKDKIKKKGKLYYEIIKKNKENLK